MLVAGTGAANSGPATGRLLVGFTAPQDTYCDSPNQGKDDFYQHLDHRLALLSASIGRPGPLPGLSSVKHPKRNPLSQLSRKDFYCPTRAWPYFAWARRC